MSPRVRYLCIGVLLLTHTGLLAWEAVHDSPTVDEPAHLAAGISHWKFGRFELYRVTPPLVRLVAALPVLAVNHSTDWSHYRDSPGARAEFPVGGDFILANGPNIIWLISLARFACIPFSILGACFCYRWAADLHGPACGLVAMTLWCFCPNILGNGHLITTDAAAAAFCIAANYVFWRWLKDSSWKSAIAAGLLFGTLQLTKATFLVLYPVWILLWLTWRFLGARDPQEWIAKGAAQMGCMFLISLYVLNACYGFEGSFKPLGEYHFVSHALGGDRDASSSYGNRFGNHWLESLPVPMPEHFVLGIDVQKRYFETKLSSYLRGEWKLGGWWYYYLYAAAIKVPLAAWALGGLAIAGTLSHKLPLPSFRDDLVLLAPPLVLLIFISAHTGFSKNLRYALPIFPFAFVFASRVSDMLPARNSWLGLPVMCGLLGWHAGSSLWVFPHSFSYFNELVGGPEHGHEHLLHTNIDWGQDLLYLQSWLQEHPEARPLGLAYYGCLDPGQYGIQYTLPPSKPQPGWYALSVNLIRGHRWSTPDGKGDLEYIGDSRYSYFTKYQPVAKAGFSIYIYRIRSVDSTSNSVDAIPVKAG